MTREDRAYSWIGKIFKSKPTRKLSQASLNKISRDKARQEEIDKKNKEWSKKNPLFTWKSSKEAGHGALSYAGDVSSNLAQGELLGHGLAAVLG